MSCRKATTASPTMDKVRTHKIYTNPAGGWRTTPQAHDAPIWRKSNSVGADSISARCKKSDFNNAAGASPLSDVDASRQQRVAPEAAGGERATLKFVFVLATTRPTLGATTG